MARRRKVSDRAPTIRTSYDSVLELAESVGKHMRKGGHSNFNSEGVANELPHWLGVESWDDAMTLARDGWADGVPAAETVARDAIQTVERELDALSFHPVWDVTGSEVDVGRFLAGTPENMIDYIPTPVPGQGRVVSLCFATAISVGISASTITRRGQGIAALAIALNALGFGFELWADSSVDFYRYGGDAEVRTRTLVKGTNDELDPAKIMFAVAHPAMHRALSMGIPERQCASGIPLNPEEDLPDGAIYLPCIRSDKDVPQADVALRGYLRMLGIIE